MQANIRPENASARAETSAQAHLPVLLLALALVIWFSFQLFQTLKTRDSLVNVYNAQEPQIQTANTSKASLSALATGIKQLAIQGNPNAAQIVGALAQRGINIADPKVPPQPLGTEVQTGIQSQKQP
jgi:cytoskeletal protein RodZ